MKAVTPKAQLDAFIAKYAPDVAALGRRAFAQMRKRLPAAHVLVYDNYNALAIGFGPTERTSDIVLEKIAVLDEPEVLELMRNALERAGVSLRDGERGKLIIKSVSAKQRPRRAAPSRAKKA
jgi:hypothetical protein